MERVLGISITQFYELHLSCVAKIIKSSCCYFDDSNTWKPIDFKKNLFSSHKFLLFILRTYTRQIFTEAY